jgi:hypothetical protein
MRARYCAASQDKFPVVNRIQGGKAKQVKRLDRDHD